MGALRPEEGLSGLRSCAGGSWMAPGAGSVRGPREQGFTVAEEETQLSRVAVGREAFLWNHDFFPSEERGDSHTSWVGVDLNDTINDKAVCTGQYDLPTGLF